MLDGCLVFLCFDCWAVGPYLAVAAVFCWSPGSPVPGRPAGGRGALFTDTAAGSLRGMGRPSWSVADALEVAPPLQR
jgi:hypothetical protein